MNMNKPACILPIILAAFIGSEGWALAQSTSRYEPAAATSPSPLRPEVLQGRWVRPDGGYLILIKGVDSDGKLDATYFNPNLLPFAKATATLKENTVRVFLELRAGGYAESTYTLAYDPTSDRLAGEYFQAVAQQKFNIYFVRAK
jgi:hypothetical protein